VDALISRAAELHPYDVPELLALPVENGLSAYLAWVGRECRVAEEE
jgi:periplasmic divalent cation tolerance protein